MCRLKELRPLAALHSLLIFLRAMRNHVRLSDSLDQAVLTQLGQRCAVARQTRGLSASALASALGMCRKTLRAAEDGKPTVTMETYVRILSALGLARDLALVTNKAGEHWAVMARRHANFELEIAAGERDARSLVAVPEEVARHSRVTFPKNAFGKPKPW